MTADDLLELMRSRRSIRRFKAQSPDRATLERLLEAAVQAPSASNQQPWRFVVVEDPESVRRMAAAVRDAVEVIAAAVRPSLEKAFRAYGDYFTRFETAPAVIVTLFRSLPLLTHMVDGRLEPGRLEEIGAMERSSGLIGASLAVQNLLLMAHAMGLGASGMTGPLVAARQLQEILEVAPGWSVLALVPVGYPDESPEPTARKPAAGVARWIDRTEQS